MKKMLMLASLLFSGSVWANVVAYWNGDLAEGSTKSGWTISAGTGVTFANGRATTTKQDGGTANTGIVITPSETYTSDALTLVIKYSGLDVCDHNVSMAEMVWGNGETMNKHVARIVGKTQCGMSNGGSQLNAANYTIPDAGTMAISMSNSGGMRISFKASDTDTFTAAAWYTGSDVKLGTKFGVMKVGGCGYNIGTYHRPGMKIESVAIIDEVIDTGSTFEVPTEYIAVPGQITTTAKLISGVTMDMLKDARIAAFSSAAHIDRKRAYTAATAMRYEDASVAMTNEFQIVDGQWVKAISVEYTPTTGGVNAKAICARYLAKAQIENFPSMFDQTGNGTTGWNTSAVVATSLTSTAGGTNYGFADMMITPNGGQVIVSEDKNWKDIELGDSKVVSAVNGATLTFAAEDTIPSGVLIGSMHNDAGICVAGTVPMLPMVETLTILAEKTAIIPAQFTGTVVVKGTYDINWTNGGTNLENPTIVLAGGTLANNGTEGVSYGAIGISKISLTADSTISSDLSLYSLAGSYNEFNFSLNGHKLTKSGTGAYTIKTGKFVGGGALDLQDGTLTLQAVKLAEGDTLELSVEDGKILQFTNGDGKTMDIAGTIKLVKGSFKAHSSVELTVEVPEGMELVTKITNNVTTYSFKEPDPVIEPDPDYDAAVGDNKYESITEAVLHVSGGATLKVLRDVTLSDSLVLDALFNGTINLNSFSITNEGEGDVISTLEGSVVTITGKGSIVKDGADYAITSRGLTTISADDGTPVIGGIVAAPSSKSKVSFAYGYYPETPVKAKIDWTGCVSNAKTPVLSCHHTDEHSFSTIMTETINPIQEIDGVLYEAQFDGGFVSETERVLMFTYLYTVAKVTMDVTENVTIPYVFNVATDDNTATTYARIAKAVASGTMNGKPLFTYTAMPADINFQVLPNSGYHNPTVKANGEEVSANENGYYHITAVEGGVAIVVTAEEIPTVPTWINSEDSAAVAKYNTWATAKGVTDPTAAKKAAFAFNCANTDAAIEAENDAFVITSIEIVDGVPQITAKMVNLAGEEYNVTPVIKGSATVDGEYTLEKDNASAKFFKAVIDLE